MKICLLSPHFPPMAAPCGVADYVEKLANGLAEREHEVVVITRNELARAHGRVAVKTAPRRWTPRVLRGLGGWIAAGGFDVADIQYEANMDRHSPWALLWPFLIARGVQRVLTIHSPELPRPGGRVWRPLQLCAYDAVVFYSSVFRDHMARRFPWRAARFHVQGFPSNIVKGANPYVGPLVARLKASWPFDREVLVYFGNISRGRGIEDLFDCLERFRDIRRPQLVLASQFKPDENEYHRELLHHVTTEGLDDQVHFTGRLAEEDVSKVLEAADVCVLPFPEGASFKNGSLAAAIEHGLPVVTTATSATEPELLQSGALRTYAPGDRPGLFSALDMVLGSPSLRTAMRQAAGRLRSVHSWERYIDGRLSMYEALVRRC